MELLDPFKVGRVPTAARRKYAPALPSEGENERDAPKRPRIIEDV
jgi:hypothetical protein